MNKVAQITAFLCLVLVFTNCSNDDDNSDTIGAQPPSDTVTDADGNVYNTIIVGGQTWMLENLKTTTYSDGTPIIEYTFVDFGNNWASLNDEIGHYQWADTSDLNGVIDEELPFDYYGAMYNHFAIESGGLAPEGWRIPTEADFIELETFLTNEGHSGDEATVLKTETGWLPGSENGTNLFDFNALPNGYINAFGGPTFAEGVCTWATSNVSGGSLPSQKRIMISLFNNGAINFDESGIQIGTAIRCIKE